MAIRDKTYKSKQAAFDAHLDSIQTAKKNHSWTQIADYLNANTNSNVGSMSYRHMLTRAKNKRNKTNRNTEKNNSTMHEQAKPDVVSKFFSSREETTVNHDSTASMDKFKEKYL